MVVISDTDSDGEDATETVVKDEADSDVDSSSERSDEDMEECEIERIISHSIRDDDFVYYKVRWVGYGPEYDAFEREDGVNADELVEDYWERERVAMRPREDGKERRKARIRAEWSTMDPDAKERYRMALYKEQYGETEMEGDGVLSPRSFRKRNIVGYRRGIEEDDVSDDAYTRPRKSKRKKTGDDGYSASANGHRSSGKEKSRAKKLANILSEFPSVEDWNLAVSDVLEIRPRSDSDGLEGLVRWSQDATEQWVGVDILEEKCPRKLWDYCKQGLVFDEQPADVNGGQKNTSWFYGFF